MKWERGIAALSAALNSSLPEQAKAPLPAVVNPWNRRNKMDRIEEVLSGKPVR